jgi:hypothetical protein
MAIERRRWTRRRQRASPGSHYKCLHAEYPNHTSHTMDGDADARWLAEFLPGLLGKPATGWLPPAVATDRADPKLAHIDGLSRCT